MTELEVRCCCHPAKLLGWLEVPASKTRIGQEFNFHAANSEIISLKVGRYYLSAMDRLEDSLRPLGDQYGLALKSDGKEKEIQKIIGFRKNGGGDATRNKTPV